MKQMKTIIVVEMLILWLGTINHYKKDYKNNLADTVAAIGVRTIIPTGILTFWLLLIADLGAGEVAALLGGIISFTYLMGSVSLLNDITDSLLAISAPAPAPVAAP